MQPFAPGVAKRGVKFQVSGSKFLVWKPLKNENAEELYANEEGREVMRDAGYRMPGGRREVARLRFGVRWHDTAFVAGTCPGVTKPRSRNRDSLQSRGARLESSEFAYVRVKADLEGEILPQRSQRLQRRDVHSGVRSSIITGQHATVRLKNWPCTVMHRGKPYSTVTPLENFFERRTAMNLNETKLQDAPRRGLGSRPPGIDRPPYTTRIRENGGHEQLKTG